jgi:hypothetical protein
MFLGVFSGQWENRWLAKDGFVLLWSNRNHEIIMYRTK